MLFSHCMLQNEAAKQEQFVNHVTYRLQNSIIFENVYFHIDKNILENVMCNQIRFLSI